MNNGDKKQPQQNDCCEHSNFAKSRHRMEEWSKDENAIAAHNKAIFAYAKLRHYD